MSTVLVTGATGQVGGAVLEELVRRGVRTRAMVCTDDRSDALAERGLPRWRAEELAFIASAYGGGAGHGRRPPGRRLAAAHFR